MEHFYFQNTSTGTYRSVIRTSSEYQKAHLLFNFLVVATHFPQKIVHSSSFMSQSEAF